MDASEEQASCLDGLREGGTISIFLNGIGLSDTSASTLLWLVLKFPYENRYSDLVDDAFVGICSATTCSSGATVASHGSFPPNLSMGMEVLSRVRSPMPVF